MEALLPQCIESLIVPGFEKVEVLIINDGSKDRTSEIAHDFVNRYPESIRCIDKENGNYGSCINRGLAEMTGKYVKILDADDSFDTEAFEKFIRFLDGVDVDLVVSDFKTVNPAGEFVDELKYNLPVVGPFSVDVLFSELAKTGYHMHCLTYRSDIFRQFEYKQTEGISYTDTEWNFIPMHKVESVAFFPDSVYKYLVSRDGQTIDPVVMTRNINQLVTVVKSIVGFSNDVGDTVSDSLRLYYRDYIYKMVLMIYRIGVLGGYKKCYNTMVDFDSWIVDTLDSDYIQRLEQERAILVPGVNFRFLKWYHKSPLHPILRLRYLFRKIVLRR